MGKLEALAPASKRFPTQARRLPCPWAPA